MAHGSRGVEDPGREPPPESDEERAFRASLEKLVDWVRVEQPRVLWRAFAPALVLVPLGGVVVGAALTGRWLPSAWGLPLELLGVLVLASGPAWALACLIRSMRQDAYVAMRVDGLAVRLDLASAEALYTWDTIADVDYDEAAESVRLELTSGEVLSLRGPFSGVSERELCRRIRDARRLAVWQRLSPRS